MGDGSTGLAQAPDLVVVKVNAMCQPGVASQPAAFFKIIQGAHAKAREAVVVFVTRLTQMCVQAHLEFRCQGSALTHQRITDRKRRAGRERYLHHGARAALMVGIHDPLAVGEDGLDILHH